jgi:hypothetical protein
MKKENLEKWVNENPYLIHNEGARASEFKILLEFFSKAIDHSSDLSTELFIYANNLKPLHEPDINNELDQKNPQGILEMFKSQLSKLENSNAKLFEVCNHLRELIGIEI